jgi:hypothetical protein
VATEYDVGCATAGDGKTVRSTIEKWCVSELKMKPLKKEMGERSFIFVVHTTYIEKNTKNWASFKTKGTDFTQGVLLKQNLISQLVQAG